MEAARTWWEGRSDSTRRALKTLWQAFLGAALAVVAAQLTGVLAGTTTADALLVAAVAAGLAAAAAKLANMGGDALDGKAGGTD